MKCHPHWWDFSVRYKNQPANEEQALIYFAIALSKAWKHHPPRQAPAEPWSGLEEMHSYWTANWAPPHLHRPLGQEGREAAGKCSGSYAWLVLFSGKGFQNQPPPLPSTPNLHLSSQHPGAHKYFKMSGSLWWKNIGLHTATEEQCLCAGKQMKKVWIRQAEHQHPPHDWADPGLSFARQPQGSKAAQGLQLWGG